MDSLKSLSDRLIKGGPEGLKNLSRVDKEGLLIIVAQALFPKMEDAKVSLLNIVVGMVAVEEVFKDPIEELGKEFGKAN